MPQICWHQHLRYEDFLFHMIIIRISLVLGLSWKDLMYILHNFTAGGGKHLSIVAPCNLILYGTMLQEVCVVCLGVLKILLEQSLVTKS